MTMLDDFKLDADITVSELRQEEILEERLRSFRRLRVRRRNDVFAILVGADEWRTLAAYVRDLEAQLERHEGEAVRQILAERLRDAEFVAATPDVIADIDREYRKLIGE
jgi:hypothetical protein